MESIMINQSLLYLLLATQERNPRRKIQAHLSMVFTLKNPWSQVQPFLKRHKKSQSLPPGTMYITQKDQELSLQTLSKTGFNIHEDYEGVAKGTKRSIQQDWPWRYSEPAYEVLRRDPKDVSITQARMISDVNRSQNTRRNCTTFDGESAMRHCDGPCTEKKVLHDTPPPGFLHVPGVAATNAWEPGRRALVVLDPTQLASFGGDIYFNLHCAYTGNGVPVLFDIRLLTNRIQTLNGHYVGQNSEFATAPVLNSMKVIFRHFDEMLELHNPKGVTVTQVFSEISKFTRDFVAKESYEALKPEIRGLVTLAYQINRNKSADGGETNVGLRRFDILLDVVYFSGLMQDPDYVEQRVGWRDPSVLVAMFEGREALISSGFKLDPVTAAMPMRWAPYGN